MNPVPHSESNIPLLTEIIHPENPVPPVASIAPADLFNLADSTPAPTVMLSEEEREQLERTLRETVLRQLLTRVDFVLEHRVRDGLADVLQITIDHLAQDIRKGLAKSLEELIQRAITQELAKIQSTRI